MNNACSPLILKLAVSSAAMSPQLAALLALQRAEEPETRVVISEGSSIDLFRGLDKGHYDVGITSETSTAFTLSIQQLWRVELAVALPLRSPLLAHRTIPLEALRPAPLIYGFPPTLEVLSRLADTVVDNQDRAFSRIMSFELMTGMVAAGYGIGIAPQARILQARGSGIVMRPFAEGPIVLGTGLFRAAGNTAPAIERFARRAHAVAESDYRNTPLSRAAHRIPNEWQRTDSLMSAPR